MAKKNNRDDFTQTTKRTLARRASYLCSNPECRCLTLGPTSDDNDKETRIGHAAQIIQSPQEHSSKDVSDEMVDLMFGGHCLSAYKGSANSGGVMATIYEGRNDEGLPIKVLHLSAGGFYLACNYIYSASPERFEQNVDMVMDFLKDLGVIFLGPPLKR